VKGSLQVPENRDPYIFGVLFELSLFEHVSRRSFVESLQSRLQNQEFRQQFIELMREFPEKGTKAVEAALGRASELVESYRNEAEEIRSEMERKVDIFTSEKDKLTGLMQYYIAV
jgi:hypothetical protein